MTGWALGELPATSSSAPSPARGGAIIDASGVWCFSAVWCALNPLHPRPSCPRLSHPPPLKSLTQLPVAGWPSPCLYLTPQSVVLLQVVRTHDPVCLSVYSASRKT